MASISTHLSMRLQRKMYTEGNLISISTHPSLRVYRIGCSVHEVTFACIYRYQKAAISSYQPQGCLLFEHAAALCVPLELTKAEFLLRKKREADGEVAANKDDAMMETDLLQRILNVRKEDGEPLTLEEILVSKRPQKVVPGAAPADRLEALPGVAITYRRQATNHLRAVGE